MRRWAGLARAASLLVVIAIHAAHLRNGAWKPAPLRGLLATFSALCLTYLVLALV